MYEIYIIHELGYCLEINFKTKTNSSTKKYTTFVRIYLGGPYTWISIEILEELKLKKYIFVLI